MKCGKCQQENPLGSNFCLGCGARLDSACASCGMELSAGSRFCNRCGAPVQAETRVSPHLGSPASYTPRHLAEKILTSRGALEGERKQVTVLFADIRGSMELLADRDPEEARKILDPILELMMEAVHRYEGTVNQVMGDGIMALFGAPLAHEDHAVRACYAALAMQASISAYSEDIRRAQGLETMVRIGLNSGEVVVRAIGSDLRMDYSAVGQTTHLAARMEQLARPGTVRLTASSLRLVEGLVRVRALGRMPIKGLAEPVEIFELVGVAATKTRFHAAAARGLTRFVGRQAELETLDHALNRAGEGHGEIVALVGEPGVGKSRLVWEFIHSQRANGWLVLESGSVSYGKATAYHPVIELLKVYFQIEDRDAERTIIEKVTGKVRTLERSLEPTLPALLALLDVPIDDAEWRALDPPQRRQRTLEACKRLVLRESQARPVLMVFEDLHWIDSATQAFLDSLVESLPAARLLLIVNYRPEYEQRWVNKNCYSQLRVDPLPPETAEQFLRYLVGDDPSLRPLRHLLIDRTEGNPFFLEETIRTLVESGALVGERGACRLITPVAQIRVPTTVQAVLAARVDRLLPEEKLLLQTAAVIGKDVPIVVLRAVAEQREPLLSRILTELQAAEFLHATVLFPDLQYTFKHALTHEVVYGGLLQQRRRELHARVVEAIERLYPDRLSEHVERLGHHAVSGEVWEKAVRYLSQAGAKLFERSANQEAALWFEQAIAALGRLPGNPDRVTESIDLRLDLRSALHALGQFDRIFEVLRDAERLAQRANDQRRLGRVYGYLATNYTFSGEYGRAIESGRQARAIAEAVDDFGTQVVANYSLAHVYFTLGDYRLAGEFTQRNIEALDGQLVFERFGLPIYPAVYSRHSRVMALSHIGLFSEAIVCGTEGCRIAESIKHPLTRIYADYALGYAYLLCGDLGQAIRHFERDRELCQEIGARLVSAYILSFLGIAYAQSGRPSEGLPLLEGAVDLHGSMNARQNRGLLLDLLGEGYLLAGRPDDALTLAERALEVSRAQLERGNEAIALRLLGSIASELDPSDPEKAGSHYREAVALAEELGMRPLVAHCHLGLGKLYRRTGKRDQAREHLTAATTMYRDMDMRFWLEQAEAELKAVT